jgi:L-amino acid N-acyltransferase YncA
MIIRTALIADLPRIVEIYNQSVGPNRSTADITPVRVQDREEWFSQHNLEKYPIFLIEVDRLVMGWCSLSAYRPGRLALRYTAEISFFIDRDHRERGLATALIDHILTRCPKLEIKNLLAIVLEWNQPSIRLLTRMGFQRWGFLPRVADFDGKECGHLYYGRRIETADP